MGSGSKQGSLKVVSLWRCVLACLSAAGVSRNRYGTQQHAAEIYRYKVLKHRAAKHKHLCKEAEMMIRVLCVTRSLLEIPHQAGSCFALHCCVTLCLYQPVSLLSPHTHYIIRFSHSECVSVSFTRFILDLACFTHSHTPLTIWL